MAVFVLAIVGAMGIALLFQTSIEVKTSRTSLDVKKAFYLAEAGLEDARATLWNGNDKGQDDFDSELEDTAGDDGVIDFDADQLVAAWDSSGNLIGVSGYGDDAPVTPFTAFGEGYYAAFVTNDPANSGGGVTSLDDTNDRVMITSIGVGPNRSVEVVQGIITRDEIFPSVPPATITLLGPMPVFEGANSTPKEYVGDDCGGAGIPGLFVPVVGTVGESAEASAELGINRNPDFASGGYEGTDTFADLTDPNEETLIGSGYGTIDPMWTDCLALKAMVENVRLVADVVCTDLDCIWPDPSPNRVIFVDGDWPVAPRARGEGLLLVTGTLDFHGRATWRGIVMAVGEGIFVRSGAGNGTISGATIVADIAGPDEIYGTADDCTGGEDGFSPVLYDERGGGNSDTTYCTTDFAGLDLVKPYDIIEFRQF
jgi:hypothetical protein